MRKFIIRYGVLGASVSIALGLLNWFFIAPNYGPKLSESMGYLTIVISLLTIPLGIKYFRDKLNGGSVSFNEGFKIGIGITLIASVIMGLYGVLFFAIEGNDFIAWQQEWFTPEEIKQNQLRMATMPEYMQTPLFQGLVMFVMVFLIGAIIDLISALTLKRASGRIT